MEGNGVEADFALFDDRLIVLKNKFNRVFERDDVLFEIAVDVFDHRRERGGFARTRRAGHEHDAARRFGDFFDLFQQAELLKAWHIRSHITHGKTPLAALLKKVRAKTPD